MANRTECIKVSLTLNNKKREREWESTHQTAENGLCPVPFTPFWERGRGGGGDLWPTLPSVEVLFRWRNLTISTLTPYNYETERREGGREETDKNDRRGRGGGRLISYNRGRRMHRRIEKILLMKEIEVIPLIIEKRRIKSILLSITIYSLHNGRWFESRYRREENGRGGEREEKKGFHLTDNDILCLIFIC